MDIYLFIASVRVHQRPRAGDKCGRRPERRRKGCPVSLLSTLLEMKWNGRVFSEFLSHGCWTRRASLKKTFKMRIFTCLLKNTNPKIEYYSRFSPSPLSIKQFLDFGKTVILRKRQGREAVALFMLLILSFHLLLCLCFDVWQAKLLGIYRIAVQTAGKHYSLWGADLAFQFGVYF